MGVTMKLTNYTAAHAGTYSELYNLWLLALICGSK
jgi:hypothetical protein